MVLILHKLHKHLPDFKEHYYLLKIWKTIYESFERPRDWSLKKLASSQNSLPREKFHLTRVSAREFPGREIPGIPVKFTFPFFGKNAVYPRNPPPPTYQVNVFKIGGLEWKYKVVKLHKNLSMRSSKLPKKIDRSNLWLALWV